MRKIKNIVSGNEISVEEVFKRGWQYKLIEEILEAGYESEKRIEALEKKEPRQDEPTIDDLGENIERVVLTKKEVRYMEDLEKRLTALEKKQEEPKQVEPDIVYGSTVSVRDQKIKKLFDEVLRHSLSWMKSCGVRNGYILYKQKLEDILEGE